MKLADYLEAHDLNISTLALAAGLPYSTVYKILSGRHQPRLPTMRAIERATNGKVSRIEDFTMPEKRSKAAVNYTDRAMIKADRCGVCRYFRQPSACTLVEGKIASAGWCKLFER